MVSPATGERDGEPSLIESVFVGVFSTIDVPAFNGGVLVAAAALPA
jgi:hypothetical protein